MRASVERLCVAWAKANTNINALVAGRVASRFPANPTLPFIRVWKVGGGPDTSEALDVALVQWDLRAASPEAADVLERTVIGECVEPFPRYNLAGVGYLEGVAVSSSGQIYDELDEWFGYSIDTFVTVKEE